MRRIVVGLLGTLSGLVMLFSYHTSTGGGSVAGRPGGSRLGNLGGGLTGQGGSTSGSGSGSGSSGTGSTGAAASGSIVKGDTAETRWGPVQVAIKVSGGRIVAVDAIQYPTGNGRDQEINSYAVPALNQEVMGAQSANIDMISGATVTSDGYIRSLQSALDRAHL